MGFLELTCAFQSHIVQGSPDLYIVSLGIVYPESSQGLSRAHAVSAPNPPSLVDQGSAVLLALSLGFLFCHVNWIRGGNLKAACALGVTASGITEEITVCLRNAW